MEIVQTNKFSVLEVRSSAATPVARTGDGKSIASSSSKKTTTPAGSNGELTAPNSSSVAPASSRQWTDELQQDLVRILSVGEECISPEELQNLLQRKGRGSDGSTGFVLYDGFEPSGRMHIAQGVFKAMNVNKCTVDGTNSTFVFWVADWFALMNDKMGGDLEKIKNVGQYLIEVWKAAGMNLSHVVFKWASEEITQNADKYWPMMLDVARSFNITRIKKCCQIMGRLEGSLTAAQILYPLMQCTDVFFLQADICQLGVDQRKVNMLAREYCDASGRKHKPIILSHHMLYGLKAGQEKMSKSDPDSAIFMEDSPEDVARKINNAYCPSREQQSQDAVVSAPDNTNQDAGKESLHLKVDSLKNPCLDYVENIIFSPPGATFAAGGRVFQDFPSVRSDFLSGQLTEHDLKQGLIDSLNRLLDPVRAHFATDTRARDLLDLIRQYKKEAQTLTQKSIRRLNLVELQQVPKECHLVFAPLPTSNPSLQSVVDLLVRLKAASGRPCVLHLPDWSARVCNACNGDAKAISAYYELLLAGIKALDTDSTLTNLTVIRQSDAILNDPSNYWISVINVGRHFMLEQVMGSLKDADGVGLVIARLMQVADVAGVEPASLALTESDNDAGSAVEGPHMMEHLIVDFFTSQLPGVTIPTIVRPSTTSIRLQPIREVDALKTENDEYFLLDDPKQHGKAKMKKAFCEPQNVQFCPPIAIASVFAIDPITNKSLKVCRSAENGGDREYPTKDELESDFASGGLHPGDLKNAVSSVMTDVLMKLSSAIKESSVASKAGKDLKAFDKKHKKR